MQNGQAGAADNGHAHGMQPPLHAPADILCAPPNLIVDAPGLRVWHKLDQTFRHALPALSHSLGSLTDMLVFMHACTALHAGMLRAGQVAACVTPKLCACRLPKAVAYFAITSKAAYESPRAAAATHLVLKLAEDALCETAYLADVAGLTYDVRALLPL
jgi:hypothetical protein